MIVLQNTNYRTNIASQRFSVIFILNQYNGNKEKKHRPRTHKGKETPAVIEKDRDPAPPKQAEKKRTRISVTAFQRPVIIAFAQVLDPEAYTDGSAVVVAEGCADAVKDFLAKI